MTKTGTNIIYGGGGGGDNHTYYIIRRKDTTVGLFSNYIVFAGHIRYALSKGYLPVIDMQNYPNAYIEPELLGKENSWERFFCQPLGIGLEEAYNGDNVILSSGDPIAPRPNDGINFFENRNNILTEWRMLVKLGLLRIQPKLYEEILSLRQKLFAPNDRMLGVLLRGTDYAAQRPYRHPIQPPLEYSLTKVIEKLNEWRCNKIFLATEDKFIAQNVKNIFGNVCVMLDKEFIMYNDVSKFVSQFHLERENDYFLRGKEYLTEMVLLSACNCLVAGRTSGTVGVMMMTNGFENSLTFNFGRYGSIGLD